MPDLWTILVSTLFAAGCAAANANSPSAPSGAEPVASSDFDLQTPDHDPASVCRGERVGCMWYERGPDFGPPGRSVTFADSTPSVPYAADRQLMRLRTLVRDCLQRARPSRQASYKVWVGPHGRVTRLEARSPRPHPRLRRCSRLLTHRVWPENDCTYGFAVSVQPAPWTQARR